MDEINMIRFQIYVSGRGEEIGITDFFRELISTGSCVFVGKPKFFKQIAPKSNQSKRLDRAKPTITGTTKPAPDKRIEHFGLPTRSFLSADKANRVLLIDDLEDHDPKDKLLLLRSYFDPVLDDFQKKRVGIFFLVPMVEAYFLADFQAINKICGTNFKQFQGDPELVGKKGNIKSEFLEYNEVAHAPEIMKQICLKTVLSNPSTCCWLRSLVDWCLEQMNQVSLFERKTVEGDFSLPNGCTSEIVVWQKTMNEPDWYAKGLIKK